MDERLPGWQTLRKRLNRREWGGTRQEAHLAQTPASRQTFGLEDIQPPSVAPEPVAAPSVAPPAAFGCLRATRSGCPRVPAAPVPQPGAKGCKPTFVQTEYWE